MMMTAVRSPVDSRSPFAVAEEPSASARPLYVLSDLGLHTDGAPLLPVALNAEGEICAYAASPHPPGVIRGFCLTGALRVPAGVAFGQVPATCLSSNGFTAGAVGTAPKALRAWASHVGAFGESLWPDSVSVARGVNASGQIVGNVWFDAGEFSLSRAFVIPEVGPAKLLTPPQGGTTIATALNDAGDIAFNAAPLGAPAGETRAWCLRDHCYIAIASLGGGRAWANAITPGGRVVGHSITGDGQTHAFLWDEGSTLDLGSLPGATSEALAANDHGVVVGRFSDATAGRRALRWTMDTGLRLLEESVAAPHGWVLHEAIAINRHNWIVGIGSLHGQPRGFLLKPALPA
jgi:probable HAF family extracellular repeat protein